MTRQGLARLEDRCYCAMCYYVHEILACTGTSGAEALGPGPAARERGGRRVIVGHECPNCRDSRTRNARFACGAGGSTEGRLDHGHLVPGSQAAPGPARHAEGQDCPIYVDVSLTQRCNLRCLGCPYTLPTWGVTSGSTRPTSATCPLRCTRGCATTCPP